MDRRWRAREADDGEDEGDRQDDMRRTMERRRPVGDCCSVDQRFAQIYVRVDEEQLTQHQETLLDNHRRPVLLIRACVGESRANRKRESRDYNSTVSLLTSFPRPTVHTQQRQGYEHEYEVSRLVESICASADTEEEHNTQHG